MTSQLWRHGFLVRYTAGALLSALGSWFNTVAIAILAYHVTGQVSAVATAVTVTVLPRVVLSPFAGILADRSDRRTLLIVLDSVSALSALPPLFVHHRSELPMLYAAVGVLQVAVSFYRPAQQAYLPTIVTDTAVLTSVNSVISAIMEISMFAGPLLAALIVARWGTDTSFIFNALSFAVSAALLTTLPRSHTAPEESTVHGFDLGYGALVRRYPSLAGLYLVSLAGCVPVFLFQGIIVAYAAHVGQPSAFTGLLYAAAGAGGVIGSLIMQRFQSILSPPAGIGIYALGAAGWVVMALVQHPLVALAVLIAIQATTMIGEITVTVYMQKDIAEHERGRAAGLLFWAYALGQLMGAFVGTQVSTAITISALWGVGVATFIASLMGWYLYLRGLRTSVIGDESLSVTR